MSLLPSATDKYVLSATSGYSNSSTGTQSYTVQAGDTLQSVAVAMVVVVAE